MARSGQGQDWTVPDLAQRNGRQRDGAVGTEVARLEVIVLEGGPHAARVVGTPSPASWTFSGMIRDGEDSSARYGGR
jgi:hypothetical protein